MKLVRGLAKVTKGVTAICNVGDNMWLHDLYVCPDIDTVTYGLAGMLDLKRGWGVMCETFSFVDQMRRMGRPAWFGLGDRDLAIHIYRTEMLRSGKNLTEVTGAITKMLGLSSEILPATNDEVTTIISTPNRHMHLQEYWVKLGARPAVKGVTFRGSKDAVPTRRVVDAVRNSDRIIIAPANPVSSIGPMLAVTGLRRELERVREKVVAVSPIIGNRPVSGPAAKYMKALGIEVSPAGVAEYYKDVAGSLVIAKTDREAARRIKQLGMGVLPTDITMSDMAEEQRLAQYLLGKVQN